ncbi:uncharacterized protein F5891DRAFT_987001 [Suillus fuscotomentosus]|uniref:Uncharacterized protein n=1 Tax=Suillus fuscotomentosus TaxID=1912939 RepID=A0AAD4DQW7_9AGAM|nr:uncharacterized protein F5891DRAFT_987001 [Suillus fuscotomentosus]KAG1890557.1 hypothetical protein F5891DRAFT_987001 [Suillus fuscotomentosus]
MTYIYNHIPRIITGFEHTGSFSDLRLDLDFACYILSQRNIGPCYWPTKVSMDDFWPLQKDPLGYIGMTVIAVPSSSLPEELSTRFWYPSMVLPKFIAKLAPWPYGHYNEAIFDGLDDIIDGMVTEDFDDSSVGQVYTEDYTTASFQQDYWQAYNFTPSSSAIGSALVPGITPISPLAQATAQTPIQASAPVPGNTTIADSDVRGFRQYHPFTRGPALDRAQPIRGPTSRSSVVINCEIIKDDTVWKSHHGALWQCHEGGQVMAISTSIHHPVLLGGFVAWSLRLAVRFHWHHLRGTFDHTPNSSLSDLRKVIGHCLKPSEDLGFCLNTDEGQTRIVRMTAVLDQAAVQLDQGQDQTLVAFDHRIVIEILGLQMAKELWHYMILRPIASNPNVCVADLYWDQVLDQGGNPNMRIISLIFYEYCQKALNRNLNRTGDTAVIKLYRRIGHLHGPPLMEIQDIGRDLGYIRPHSALISRREGSIPHPPVPELLENLELRPLCLLLLVDSNKPLTVPFHTSNCGMNGQHYPFNTVIVHCLTSSLAHAITCSSHLSLALEITWSSRLGEENLFATYSHPPMILPQEGEQGSSLHPPTMLLQEEEESLFATYLHPLMILPQEGEQVQHGYEYGQGEYYKMGNRIIKKFVAAWKTACTAALMALITPWMALLKSVLNLCPVLMLALMAGVLAVVLAVALVVVLAGLLLGVTMGEMAGVDAMALDYMTIS